MRFCKLNFPHLRKVASLWLPIRLMLMSIGAQNQKRTYSKNKKILTEVFANRE